MDAWGSPLATEFSYNARGKQIGYQCYGNFDPSAPYKGQKLLPFCYEKK